MDKTNTPPEKGTRRWAVIVRNLVLYGAVVILALVLLARPIGDAVRRADAAAFWILLAALGAVGLNWLTYAAIHRRPPSLPVFAHGTFCLFLVAVIEYEAVPKNSPLASTLAIVAGYLAAASMLLLSFRLAVVKNRAAHVVAVGIWILVGLALCAMAYQVIREIEIGRVNQDTWISLGSMAAFSLGLCAPLIRRGLRRRASRKRKTALAEGIIVQIIGETYLDDEGDAVTPYFARILYEVEGVTHETRAPIYRIVARRYGKGAFLGRTVPVWYEPADPDQVYVKRIDRHVLETDSRESPTDQDPEENTAPKGGDESGGLD